MNPELKIIAPAKFFAGGITGYGESMAQAHRENSIIQRAVVEINGVRLESSVPKSAADAAFINRALSQLVDA